MSKKKIKVCSIFHPMLLLLLLAVFFFLWNPLKNLPSVLFVPYDPTNFWFEFLTNEIFAFVFQFHTQGFFSFGFDFFDLCLSFIFRSLFMIVVELMWIISVYFICQSNVNFNSRLCKFFLLNFSWIFVSILISIFLIHGCCITLQLFQCVFFSITMVLKLSLIHIWRCRRYSLCRSRWSPYH